MNSGLIGHQPSLSTLNGKLARMMITLAAIHRAAGEQAASR
jgi:hypothetical protein